MNENNLNILIENDEAPIYVTQEEYEFILNAKVVEDARNTYAQKKWAKLIKELSDYTCECCGSKENLVAHHLISFKYCIQLRLHLKNGICLCSKCHTEYHKKYNLKVCSPLTLLNFIKEFNEKRLK